MNTVLNKKSLFPALESEKRRDASPYISLFALLFFAALIALPEVTEKAVKNSLLLCIDKLIPALFPSMVIGEILFSLGFHKVVAKQVGGIFSRHFALPGIGAGAFVLGLLCGLPLGGRYAYALYSEGRISKEECERLMAFSSNPSPAFVIMGVGNAMLGSIPFGIMLYTCQILSVFTVGAILKKGKKIVSSAPVNRNTDKKSIPEVLTDAVSSSALAMLKISAFTVFFSVILAFIEYFGKGLPKAVFLSTCALTEMSSACKILTESFRSIAPVNPKTEILLTFFAIGFSGMSAHLQIASFCDKKQVSIGKYIFYKLLIGAFCAFYGAASILIFRFCQIRLLSI